MKNISTLLSVIALLGVGVVLYLHITHTEALKKQIVVENQKRDSSHFRIAYFDIDTLQAHFDQFRDAEETLKKKEEQKNAELNQYNARYQRRLKELQAKASTMTQAEGESAQNELAQMQNNFQKREFELDQDMKKTQMDLMGNLRKKIEAYLDKYNKDKGYAYILSYEPGFMIYYKDSAYDITQDLIKGLNDEYKSQK